MNELNFELEMDMIHIVEQDLEISLFPNSEISLQVDLYGGQGSGANTYGSIDFIDVINLYNNYKNIKVPFLDYTIDYFKSNPLTTEECNRLEELYNILYETDIILEYNKRYTYSKAFEIDFYELREYDLDEQLEEGDIIDTDIELIKKFDSFLRELFETLNKDIYKFLSSLYI